MFCCVQAKKLTPHFKSEEIPESNDEPVKVQYFSYSALFLGLGDAFCILESTRTID